MTAPTSQKNMGDQEFWNKYRKIILLVFVIYGCLIFVRGCHSCYRMLFPYCPEHINLSMSIQDNAEGTPKTLLISLTVPEGQILESTQPQGCGVGTLDVSYFFEDSTTICQEIPISVCRELSKSNVLVYDIAPIDSELGKSPISKLGVTGNLPFYFTSTSMGVEQKKGAFQLKNCIYSSPCLTENK